MDECNTAFHRLEVPSLEETSLIPAESFGKNFNSDTELLNKRAEGSLLTLSGLTLHPHINNAEILQKNPLIKELYKLRYPLKSLNCMLNCGVQDGHLVKKCGCGNSLIPKINYCDSRTCPNCAIRRKKRLRKRYLPFLKGQKITREYGFYFLTISPKNYSSLEYGLAEIRKNFSKWRRHKYIGDRMKAGFFVIEAKEVWKGKPQYDDHGNFLYLHEENGWNIHLHAIIYSRRLDNRIRGRCLYCNQNLLKYDRKIKKYFCASHKCNSFNVLVKKHSKLNQCWLKSTGSTAQFDITKLLSPSKSLNYVLKYISVDKGDFQNVESKANYILVIRSKRLISSFGLFYKEKIPKLSDTPRICEKCMQEIEYVYDNELVNEILYAQQKKSIPPSDVLNGDVC